LFLENQPHSRAIVSRGMYSACSLHHLDSKAGWSYSYFERNVSSFFKAKGIDFFESLFHLGSAEMKLNLYKTKKAPHF